MSDRSDDPGGQEACARGQCGLERRFTTADTRASCLRAILRERFGDERGPEGTGALEVPNAEAHRRAASEEGMSRSAAGVHDVLAVINDPQAVGE